MIQKEVTKHGIGIAKRILTFTMTGCMVFSYCGNLSIPTVYAMNTKTLDTTTAEQPLSISPATPKNATTNTYTDAQGITYTLNSDQTCVVSGCTYEVSRELVIPEKITINNTTYSVTGIKARAFYQCSRLTSVSIGKNITIIENRAFYGCSNLTTVNTSKGLTTIEAYAFYSCKNLTTVNLSSTVTSIAKSTFSHCENLNAINADKNNQTYKSIDGVLYTKTGDTLILCPNGKKTLKIPSTVTCIGDNAFENGIITSVNIPSSVTTIGDFAFAYCNNLSSITIPSSVKTIGISAFYSCQTLTKVTLSEGIKEIYGSAFSKCSSLTNITIPSSVTYMSYLVFSDCISLTTVVNRSKMATIPAETFSGCCNLTTVNIPETVTYIEDSAFENCIALKSITLPEGVTYIDDSAFRCCNHLTSINIPSNIETIDDYAFFGCFQLKSAFLPTNISTIGNGAFSRCPNLTIYGEPGSKVETYAKSNGIPFHATYKITYQLNGGTNNTKNPSIYPTQTTVKLASPTRAGYIFKGWYKTANFKSNSKVTTISKSSKGNITLYAKWAEVKKPAKAALKTVKSKKFGTLTITAKKVKSVAGYEYTVATNKKFTKNVKTVTSKKLTTTIKGLKKGKTYYVKVRAYKLDSTNRKIYGKYSSAKKVKIKK